MFIIGFISNQVEHSDFICFLLIIYFIIRISFFSYLVKIFLGQPRFFIKKRNVARVENIIPSSKRESVPCLVYRLFPLAHVFLAEFFL